jgi:Protein of unknown function (DUF3140)
MVVAGPLFWSTMAKSDEEVWYEWRSLVNMTPAELRRFLDEWGDVAGLSRSEAKAEGVRSGRDSARAILRMLPKGGRSYPQAERNWTKTDWEWARRQVGFIQRMRGVKGPLYDRKGEPTRKLLALLVWGHDPEKP